MAGTSDLEKSMRATTQALLNAFSGSWQPGATLDLRAPECEHHILPKSLNIPKRSNEDYRTYFEKVAPLVTGGKMIMDDYVVVPAERRVVCLSSLEAESIVGPYQNTYVWFLWFDESGSKITKIVEMLDGVSAKALLEKIQEQKGEVPGH